MSRDNDRQLQASLSHQELLDWAVQRYRDTRHWPVLRYRVEGSRVGNSRLLSQYKARATAHIYGGEVAEVLPTLSAYKFGLDPDKRKELES